ncbi:MAG TPA: homoserine dehydrogenase [Oleiagrimonas sp.]|nr:homoserine dehydrogenase [Oleiagrimonas sp.]
MNARVSKAPAAANLQPAPPPAARSRMRTLTLAVVGPGHVGSALLQQLRETQAQLRRSHRLDLKLCAVVDSRHMWLDCDDAALNTRTGGAQTWRPAALDELANYLKSAPNALIVDCSASEQVVDHYADWLRSGIHIVTPNKLAPAGPIERWRRLQECAEQGGSHWLHETTVGAGLPVLKTLRDLIDTGDRLESIEGMLSGTMAWLFYHFDGQRPFSELVREAVDCGYAEPDARQDLGGVDVARKLVILARQAGMQLSLDEVEVQSLVPAGLADVDAETFAKRLGELDEPMARRLAEADACNGVLRYVARLEADGRARVQLQAVPRSHPLAHARLTDNMIVFATRRYNENPLVVQGPGAGPEVTAAGVFADVLRVAEALPA